MTATRPLQASDSEFQELQARERIRDVLVRYFHGADRADERLVRTCFTEDVQAKLEGRPPVRGIDALIAQMAVLRSLPSGEWTISTHFMGSLWFKQLEADAAETETYAFAFLVSPHEGSERVRMRSLRYVDRLVRCDGDWKIAARLHTLDWSCEVPCDFARMFALRQNSLPPR